MMIMKQMPRHLRIRSPVGAVAGGGGFPMPGGHLPAATSSTPVRGKSLMEDLADPVASDAEDALFMTGLWPSKPSFRM